MSFKFEKRGRTMKTDFEKLFYLVYEHFNCTQEYHRVRLECWEKQNGSMRKIGVTPKNMPLYSDLLEKEDLYNHTRLYIRYNSGEWWIWELCELLGIDKTKLYGFVRSILKWHEDRDWQSCFPFDKNHDRILNYLRKE